MKILPVALILCIIAVSGCVMQNSVPIVSETFETVITVEPQVAYTGDQVIVTASVENYGNKTYHDIYVDMFDDGALQTYGQCSPMVFDPFGRVEKLPELVPKEIVNLQPCTFLLPNYIEQERLETTLKFRSGFSTFMEMTQLIPVVSQTAKEAGDYQKYPNSYRYSDGNLEVTISFNEELPLVARRMESFGMDGSSFIRENVRYIMYIKIRNIGTGFVSDLKGRDIRFLEQPPGIIKQCDYSINDEFVLRRNEFKKITCELNPEIFTEIPSSGGVSNYVYNLNVVAAINYTYETRQEVPITVLR